MNKSDDFYFSPALCISNITIQGLRILILILIFGMYSAGEILKLSDLFNVKV